MSFEANQGQTDSKVKFIARGSGYTLFLTDTEAVLALKKADPKAKADLKAGRDPAHPERMSHPDKVEFTTLRMKLEGAKSDPRVSGLEELPGKVNYFIGNDPAKWHTNIPTYSKVQYSEVYPGINLVYYGNQRQLEYDLVVQPGADPNRIKLAFEGADDIQTDANGDLILKINDGELHFKKPLVYQDVNGTRQPISAQYILQKQDKIAGLQVGVKVAAYDAGKPLIIDPVLSYSTYLGGSDWDQASGIAVDGSGNAYVTGYTYSTDFPTASPLQSVKAGGYDAFVVKLNASGSTLVYSTYLGGGNDDWSQGIAVDGSGNAYVTGYTPSTDFPTVSPLQATNNGGISDGFVSKLNATGSALLYSTYLGGSAIDVGYGIAVDGSGNAYVTGKTNSINFPTSSPFQATNSGGDDAFVAKINAAGSALVYSTYLGGGNGEFGYGIAIDGSDNAYVTGYTYSTDFPTVSPLQSTNGGGGDIFVSKLNAAGSALVYSTYLGGSLFDGGYGIAVDGAGNAYVTGVTVSTNFPTASALFGSYAGFGDAFVAKLNAAGSALMYSTYVGGGAEDDGYRIAVDGAGNAYVAGLTLSGDFPMASPIQSSCGGCNELSDAFVAKLNATGSALAYSTFLGGTDTDSGNGIAVDGSGNAYVTGYTVSTNFPTASPLQSANAGAPDVFVAKVGSSLGGNQEPTAGSQLVATSENTPAVITLSGFDDSSSLTFSIVAPPTHGTLGAIGPPTCFTIGAGKICFAQVSYSPALNYTGPDIFTFAVNDGSLTSEAAAVSVNVGNTLPVLAPIGNQTVNEGALLQFTVVATDTNLEGTLTLSATGLPQGTTFSAAPGQPSPATGQFSWTPDSGQAGIYNVHFEVTDGTLIASEDITITVNDTLVDNDLDGVRDDLPDDCLSMENPDQSDMDGDGVGDECDNSPLIPNPSQDSQDNAATATANIVPSDSEYGYFPGEAINITVKVKFTTNTNLPNYYVAPPDAFNVIPQVKDSQGHVLDPDRIPEGPPRSIPQDLVPITGPQTLSTTLNLRDWFSTLPLGNFTVDLRYVNLWEDPDFGPDGSCTATPPDTCYKLWLGTVSAGTLNFALSAPPDLVMTQVQPNAPTVSAGATLSVTDTVLNQGASPARPFSIAYHLSVDPDTTYGNADDIVIATRRQVGSLFNYLAPGAPNSANTSLQIPATTPAGTYHVCAMADVFNVVVESNESNNTLCSNPMVTVVPRPDLIVTALSTTGIISKGMLPVSVSVKNQGGVTAGTSSIVAFHLSADATYGGGVDEYNSSTSWTIGSLHQGTTVTVSTKMRIPSGIPSGAYYYVCVMADSTGAVIEGDDNNNTRCTTTTVTVP
jgi:hypothetical protein